MKSTAPRPILAGLLALGAAAVFHFATPLALCGQESGAIGVQAQVVDARAAWTAHHLVEQAVEARIRVQAELLESTTKVTEPDAGSVPSPAEAWLRTVTEVEHVVLRREEGAGGLRFTVADLSH
jgi:hypothetical protein